MTGGTRGIGRAICERLIADGHKVAAGYSGNEEAAAACAKTLGVMVVKGNVGSFDDCAAAVKTVEAELGPIDILVNNAGITRDGMLHKMTYEQWSEVIRVNMDSAFNMTRPGDRGHARPRLGSPSSTSARSTARRARWARPTIQPPRPA